MAMLLGLLLWPAPIPVGHVHGDQVARLGDQQLLRHLCLHHGGLANAAQWPDDWHWHWVYPGDAYVGLGGEQATTDADWYSVAPSVEMPTLGGESLGQPASSARIDSRPRLPRHLRYSFLSVAVLHSRQSLPEFLGVIRC